jgi:hypothetical protein
MCTLSDGLSTPYLPALLAGENFDRIGDRLIVDPNKIGCQQRLQRSGGGTKRRPLQRFIKKEKSRKKRAWLQQTGPALHDGRPSVTRERAQKGAFVDEVGRLRGLEAEEIGLQDTCRMPGLHPASRLDGSRGKVDRGDVPARLRQAGNFVSAAATGNEGVQRMRRSRDEILQGFRDAGPIPGREAFFKSLGPEFRCERVTAVEMMRHFALPPVQDLIPAQQQLRNQDATGQPATEVHRKTEQHVGAPLLGNQLLQEDRIDARLVNFRG